MSKVTDSEKLITLMTLNSQYGKFAYRGNYCGCCGRECESQEWCLDCAKHLHHNEHLPPWERTYFAQHKIECPFSELA